ncbi:hypothetical protein [Streptomyces albidoflavus]|uniref:hypothetical protein n=1 Tax=Streptomyces albidoflavus TaxID=1886 RepID=UPI0035E205C3
MVTQIIEPDEATRTTAFNTPTAPLGGFYEDMEKEDNDLGPMPDETEGQQRLGRHLRRVIRQQDAAIPAHRRAPRTLAEMQARLVRLGAAQPGYERQPVLVLHHPTMQDDACPLCLRWNCNPANCPPAGLAPANARSARRGSCGLCDGTGVRQITVIKTGADGKTYQGVRTEPCPAC